jgi:hypothetical protein
MIKRDSALLMSSDVQDTFMVARGREEHKHVKKVEVKKEEARSVRERYIDAPVEEMERAAASIGACTRGHLTRKHLKEEKEAATKIQTSFRGQEARKEVRNLKHTRHQQAVLAKAADRLENAKRRPLGRSAGAKAIQRRHVPPVT